MNSIAIQTDDTPEMILIDSLNDMGKRYNDLKNEFALFKRGNFYKIPKKTLEVKMKSFRIKMLLGKIE